MPKSRRNRRPNSYADHRSTLYPYNTSTAGRSSCTSTNNGYNDKQPQAAPCVLRPNKDEWEQVRCCICMEPPHNAVILDCASRDKGCSPYICDTSYRHSNCLDQFYKLSLSSQPLACPLCRGQVKSWDVERCSRDFMNSKKRICSLETCDFIGNYSQLRRHARQEHPDACPTGVDPTCQLEWTRSEDERDSRDLLSSLGLDGGTHGNVESFEQLYGGWCLIQVVDQTVRYSDNEYRYSHLTLEMNADLGSGEVVNLRRNFVVVASQSSDYNSDIALAFSHLLHVTGLADSIVMNENFTS